MPELSEEEIQSLYMWIDEIPLSKPKKNISRDFSDGVCVAEVIRHFLPRMIEIHNYSPANSISQKVYNWSTLNQKVFRKLGYNISDAIINAIVNIRPGYVEYLLYELRQKIEEFLLNKPPSVKSPVVSRKKSKSKSNGSKNSTTQEHQLKNAEKIDVHEKYDEADLNPKNYTMFNNPYASQSGYPLQPTNAYLNYAPQSIQDTKQTQIQMQMQPPLLPSLKPKAKIQLPKSDREMMEEMMETLQIMQMKTAKLETLVKLKDKKIEEISKRNL